MEMIKVMFNVLMFKTNMCVTECDSALHTLSNIFAMKQICRDGWFLHYCWFHSERPYVSTLGERYTAAVSSFLLSFFSNQCAEQLSQRTQPINTEMQFTAQAQQPTLCL